MRRGAAALASFVATLPVLAFAGDDAALFVAAEHGDRITASRLLDSGANPNARAVDETAPLHWAARTDDLATVNCCSKRAQLRPSRTATA